MFTGIIETIGTVHEVATSGSNIHLTVESAISGELKIDQSVSHNGVCLTVVDRDDSMHTVTVVRETLQRSNLGKLVAGDLVNLERSMRIGDRLDGHIVQGHVDATATILNKIDEQGSWRFLFAYPPKYRNYLIPKGSVCINGVSLTVIDPVEDQFSIAVIPYTYTHTNFHKLNPGDLVNIEWDLIGKYILRSLGK